MRQRIGRFDLNILAGIILLIICLPGLALGWFWLADVVGLVWAAW